MEHQQNPCRLQACFLLILPPLCFPEPSLTGPCPHRTAGSQDGWLGAEGLLKPGAGSLEVRLALSPVPLELGKLGELGVFVPLATG